MAEPVRLQVRCDEEAAREYRKAAKAFGLTQGEFAFAAARFALKDESDFEKFLTKLDREREKRR